MTERLPQRLGEAPDPADPADRAALTRARWKKAGVLSTGLFRGTYTQADTGHVFTYAGSYKVAIDLLCRESMHLFGTVYSAGVEANFAVHGLVDHDQSFFGREHDAAVAWVNRHCEHTARVGQAEPAQAAQSAPAGP